jgi:AcrR family transcriptional regulator
VTVAQIADAANVSAKTLFVCFRSKEDLAFTDTSLLDLCVAAIERRSPGTSPGKAVAEALATVIHTSRQTVTDGIEGASTALITVTREFGRGWPVPG